MTEIQQTHPLVPVYILINKKNFCVSLLVGWLKLDVVVNILWVSPQQLQMKVH
jgi:hypothetical protein